MVKANGKHGRDTAGGQRPRPVPTRMGARIIDFMQANGITNNAQFADSLGISRQTFHAWLYKEMNAEKIAARPILLCAEALNTNPEYLLCIHDDPRPQVALEFREAQLIDAFRVMTPTDQDRLLRNARDWVAESETAPTAAAPFRTKFAPAGRDRK